MTPGEVRSLINQKFQLNITYNKAWRSIGIAKMILFGAVEESYSYAEDPRDVLMRTNPGSFVDVQLDEEDHSFERMFVCFNASIQWSRHQFATFSNNHYITNNLSKSFNSRVLDARSLPAMGLVDKIRNKLMKQIEARRKKQLERENLCPLLKSIYKILAGTLVCGPLLD